MYVTPFNHTCCSPGFSNAFTLSQLSLNLYILYLAGIHGISCAQRHSLICYVQLEVTLDFALHVPMFCQVFLSYVATISMKFFEFSPKSCVWLKTITVENNLCLDINFKQDLLHISLKYFQLFWKIPFIIHWAVQVKLGILIYSTALLTQGIKRIIWLLCIFLLFPLLWCRHTGDFT